METRNTALMIFDQKPIQDDIVSYHDTIIHPKASPENGGPIEFDIPATAEHYIDTNKTLLYVRLNVRKADGTKIADANKLAMTNLPIASLFSDVNLTLHNTQVDGGQSAYPYIGYLNTLLNMHPSAKDTHLHSVGWFMDEADEYDTDEGSGFLARQKMIENSGDLELMGPLFLDFFRQERYLVSSVPMNLKFLRTKPEFALMGFAGGNYKITIKEMNLRVRELLMNPSVISGHQQGMKTQHAHYPIQYCDFDTFTIPAGNESYNKDRLYPYNTPRLLLVAMVDNAAYNGELKLNPFHFQHFNLSKLSLTKNGIEFPAEAFQPDFKAKMCLREYYHTMEALGYTNTDDTNGLTADDFLGGSTIFAFDMTDDNTLRGQHKQVNKKANLRLHLQFSAALPKTINVIMLAFCDSYINITQTKNVLVGHQR